MTSYTNGSGLEEKKTSPQMPFNSKENSSEIGSVEGLDILALATDEHPAHPRNWPVWKKWSILFTLCTFQAFMYPPYPIAHTNNSLMTSTAYLSIEFLIQEQFNSSIQVTALGQSLFIIGTAVGPLCLGPLS